MGRGNFTEDFKLDAIKQIRERGHSVADVSKRLGVSTHSLCGWMKRYAGPPAAAFMKQHNLEHSMMAPINFEKRLELNTQSV